MRPCGIWAERPDTAGRLCTALYRDNSIACYTVVLEFVISRRSARIAACRVAVIPTPQLNDVVLSRTETERVVLGIASLVLAGACVGVRQRKEASAKAAAVVKIIPGASLGRGL